MLSDGNRLINILEFLMEDAHVKVNVLDRFGLTPLHNACTVCRQWRILRTLIIYFRVSQPHIVLLEDNTGKIPFALILPMMLGEIDKIPVGKEYTAESGIC
mmetsp:Transcript_7279/g.7134  ORF Transcript_7279/g.7134 Transcript_7279/m.7134 type:complete len:101 (-) Transcript_7279:35-337(-)